MQNIEKLKERQKAIEAKRRAIALKIRKAEEEEKKGRFTKAGQELADHFKNDPDCKESSKIVAICARYFVSAKTEAEPLTDEKPISLDHSNEHKKTLTK
jgi:FtsZ-interacting cell division protein YlmF